MSQIQNLVAYCDKNKGTVVADHYAEVVKMHAELPTLDENAYAIVTMITDSECLIHLRMRKKRIHTKMS